MEIPILNLTEANTTPAQPAVRKSVRRMTRQVNIGGIKVGGNAPISVQTMTKTKTADVQGTVRQIIAAAEAGCDIVRVTVNDKEAADAISAIVRESPQIGRASCRERV